MSYHNYSQCSQPKRRHRFVLLLPVVLLWSVVSARAEDGKAGCRAFYGPFTSVVVAPPDCVSPVGLCTHGILTGEFPATYDFTALTKTADPTDPNLITLTGRSIVTTAKGVIYTNDVSVINFVSGDFVTKALVHRTNLREDNRGGFIAAGNLNTTNGQATGNYSAILCSREDD